MILNDPFEFLVAVAKLDIPASGKEVPDKSVKAKVLVLAQILGTMKQAGISS